jgi:ParB family chromosome partitioning protein
MRIPWRKSKPLQLDLLSPAPAAERDAFTATIGGGEATQPTATSFSTGRPLTVPTTSLFEDPSNPRTEFPEAELEELAEDFRQHGILQPIVVHPADGDRRYRIHFGARRLRAAIRAGLREVPVVIREMLADHYAQVAENQKRHGLSSLDLARFIKSRVEAGDSNATVAKRLGMNLTTVAHHLALRTRRCPGSTPTRLRRSCAKKCSSC